MPAEIAWICNNCKEKNTNAYDTEVGETVNTLKEWSFPVYCSECNNEFVATTENSKITITN